MLLNLEQWLLLESRYSLVHIIKGQGQTADVVYLYFDPLLDDYQTSYTGWLWREDYPYCFLGHKVKIEPLVFISELFAQCFTKIKQEMSKNNC